MTILHLSNDTDRPFVGWQRCNVDVRPTFLGGGHPDANWMLGARSGLATWNLDVFTSMQPGERKTLNLDDGSEALRYVPPPPLDDWLGGVPVTFAGVSMQCLFAKINGAGYEIHYRCRVGRSFVVDLFLSWWPDQPEWCPGEVIVTASNPLIEDLVETIPPDFRLVVGDATVMVVGLPDDAPLMNAGDWLADAQPRLLPLALHWARHETEHSRHSARAYADQLVQCRGIERMHQHGNPGLPAGFDGPAWTKALLPDVIRVAHNWDQSPLDPNVLSGTTGAQGAQSFSGAPAMADPSCIGPIYLAGLDVSWPMCHLEVSGDHLYYLGHPGLRMLNGRVNRQLPSADNLGKSAEPSTYDRHGYSGPGYEWDFDFTAWSAARVKGTPGTQWVLEAHARLLMFTLPTASTADSWLPPNRGVGWWGFKVGELYRNLRNRDLAEALKARWIETFNTLIQPRMGTAEGWWSWRDDALGGTPANPRAIPWQCSVLALGLRWAGDALDHWDSVVLATTISEDYIARAWFHGSGNRWHVRDLIAKDGGELGYHDAYYPHFGVPHGIAAMLLWNNTHGVAWAIWNQINADCDTWQKASWLAPVPVTP